MPLYLLLVSVYVVLANPYIHFWGCGGVGGRRGVETLSREKNDGNGWCISREENLEKLLTCFLCSKKIKSLCE